MTLDRWLAPFARLAGGLLAAALSTPCLLAAPAPPPGPPTPAAPAAPAPAPLTLERIMADPDWIGNAPEEPYWADDGRAVYYRRKQQGHELRDLYRLELASGEARIVPFSEEGKVDAPGGELSHDRQSKVYVRAGDVYVKDLRSGALRQLTRTAQEAADAHFMVGDQRVSFRSGDNLFVYDLATGLVSQPADLRLQKDPAVAAEQPDKDPGADYLKQQQRRLFDAVRERRSKEKEQRARDDAERRADPTRAPLPWYLGEKIKLETRSLAPNGDWLLLVTTPKDAKEAKKARMPNYVTESGYVEDREVRDKVGTGKPIPQRLLLLDLREHQRYELALDGLPGIAVDPLEKQRGKATAARKEAAAKLDAEDRDDDADQAKDQDHGKDKDKEKKSKPRPVAVIEIKWSEDGRHAAVELASADYKDRWIATVEPGEHRLVSRHHLSDPAWINWDNNEFGWLRDSATIYYLSEESGYSHLYLAPLAGGPARALTSGRYEATVPRLSSDGRYLYYLANASHPGIHEVWRADVQSGRAEQLTRLGGGNALTLSPDGNQLLLLHSEIARPGELYVQDARPGAPPRRLTSTTSADFLAQRWAMPEVVPIPSTRVKGVIYARVYTPAGLPGGEAGGAASAVGGGRRPAVVFIHGAGYLQNAHYGWSYYFHEFMFHSLLVERGYVVLDMDYRASAGYGRDWRTAIYRNMGHPELEDLADGVAWLAAHRDVDPARVGVYGGSYGGFLTLMALFRQPELFACGAALRPVTDWAHYNETYTGAILNSPDVDPEAYRASSPIEYAAGLARPLQICAGMQDDNVHFQDDVRLVQRLIELKKENFDLALYPLEAHGFKAPVAWLDEYRRIFKLFETHLQPAAHAAPAPAPAPAM